MKKRVFGIGGLLGMLAGFATYAYIDASSYLEFDPRVTPHIAEMPSFIFFLFGLLGGIAGGFLQKCRTVNLAFLIGSASFLLITSMLSFIWWLCFYSTPVSGIKSVPNFYFTSFFILFSACTGSLASGLSAITIRDYRQSQRVRFIPQFTLSEVMIVVTLIATILGCIMSVKILHK